MAIKITNKMLSIPPHISTHWSHIAALHMKEDILAITLVGGDTLHIANLNSETARLIFQYHALYLDSLGSDLSKMKGAAEREESSIRLAFGSSIDGLGSVMEHNPSQADAPDLSQEILEKIGAIAKIIAPAEEILLPKAEPGCNCFHCQIARALNPLPSSSLQDEHDVTDQDLHFQQWTITQTGEKLFSVASVLDEHEKYNVYLGNPVGCTCGKQGCEHMLAVLKS